MREAVLTKKYVVEALRQAGEARGLVLMGRSPEVLFWKNDVYGVIDLLGRRPLWYFFPRLMLTSPEVAIAERDLGLKGSGVPGYVLGEAVPDAPEILDVSLERDCAAAVMIVEKLIDEFRLTFQKRERVIEELRAGARHYGASGLALYLYATGDIRAAREALLAEFRREPDDSRAESIDLLERIENRLRSLGTPDEELFFGTDEGRERWRNYVRTTEEHNVRSISAGAVPDSVRPLFYDDGAPRC